MAKKKPLKPGLYNAMIDKVTGHKDGTVTVQMSLFGKDFKFTERLRTWPIKETDATEGHQRFFVTCNRLSIYTSIGADNRHHASNKCTKLFGPHWSQLTTSHSIAREYAFVPVAEFSELIKTLPN